MPTDIRDLVKQQFGAHAQQYVNSTHHATGDSLNRMLELVAPRPSWHALDVATGGGHTALAFAPYVRALVATDLTAQMLAAAEQFIRSRGATNVTFREADAMALPFLDAEFDLVTCRIAAHHFPDCAQFARETARVLRPGGVAAMVDNVVPEDIAAARHINAFEKLRDPSHNWAYTAADWVAFFSAAGLDVSHSEIFRKTVDFDYWCHMMGVEGQRRDQLQVLLLQAPAAARDALAPQVVGGALKFQLTETLLIANRPSEASSGPPGK